MEPAEPWQSSGPRGQSGASTPLAVTWLGRSYSPKEKADIPEAHLQWAGAGLQSDAGVAGRGRAWQGVPGPNAPKPDGLMQTFSNTQRFV